MFIKLVGEVIEKYKIREKKFTALRKIINFVVTLFLFHTRLKAVVLRDRHVGC